MTATAAPKPEPLGVRNPPPENRCVALNQRGKRCLQWREGETERCGWHRVAKGGAK